MVSDIVPLSGENYIMNSASIHLHTFQFIVAYPGPELSTCSILQSMIVHALTKENRDSNIYLFIERELENALDKFYLCWYQFELCCERQCKVRWCNLWHWAGDLNTIGGQIRLFHNPHKPKHDVFMCFHNASIVCEVLCSMQMMILRIASPSLRLLMVTS